MRSHIGSWFVAIIAAALLAPGLARADLACRTGGVVAKSADGKFELVSSSYGCRNFPERTLQIVKAGKQAEILATVKGAPWYGPG
jgi:hypothetical protein